LDRSLWAKESKEAEITHDSDVLVKPFDVLPTPNTSFAPHDPIEPKAASKVAVVASESEEAFEVHTMLLWAVKEVTGATDHNHPDYYKRSDPHDVAWEVPITKMCVPGDSQSMWRDAFTGAVDLMLGKTLHGMQHGLMQVAHSVVQLVETTDCGLLAHGGLEKLVENARRLNVLTSAGSVNDLDVAVKYEPLKALTVGGVDIHTELNELIIAWRFNKGPQEMGRALAKFLKDFSDEGIEKEDEEDVSSDSTASSEKVVTHEKMTPRFWTEVLQKAMGRLGGGQELMSESCLSVSTTRRYGDALEDAIARMLEKTQRGMRAGIEEVANATMNFVDSLASPCSDATGAKRLRTAASRLHVFASAKLLGNFAKHVEYEPMQVLKVGGIDVHKELNRFLLAWINHLGAAELAEGLVDFFEDFKEHEAEEESAAPNSSTSDREHFEPALSVEAEIQGQLVVMLRDAIGEDRAGLPDGCFPDALAAAFDNGVEKSINLMLAKQQISMELGLKELADVTQSTLKNLSQSTHCTLSRAAHELLQGSRKLQNLCRKLRSVRWSIVDYDAHIQYEALKSLVVGNVNIYAEINAFLQAWKLRSRKEAGIPFGALLRKLGTIEGHDEL
jgi:hypothetical protein